MSKATEADAKLDGLFAGWPVPEREGIAWVNFRSRLERRLDGLTPGLGDEAWLNPPMPATVPDVMPAIVPATPQDESSSNPHLSIGGATMSDSEADKPKKKSLKDFAQRVSTAPPASTSQPPPSSAAYAGGASLAPASSLGQDPRPSLRSSAASMAFATRPPEAQDNDSGVVNLRVMQESSQPDGYALPAQSGLLVPEAVAVAEEPERKQSYMPIVIGGIVACVAIAAAIVLYLRSPDGDAQGQAAAAADSAQAVAMVTEPQPEQQPDQQPATGEAPKTEDAPPAASAEPDNLADEPQAAKAHTTSASQSGGAVARAGSGSEPTAATAVAAATGGADTKPADTATAAPKDTTSLSGAMAHAVGDDAPSKQDTGKSSGASVDGSVPEQPSQGAVSAAIAKVRESARACVAHQDEPSKATVTFASSGTVSSVSVSGAAAGTSAASCIQAALKRASVGPFRKPSFTTSVTIRP